MKKVSTVATKQSRNFSQQKLTIGLDVRDRSSYYCVLDESGTIMLNSPTIMRVRIGCSKRYLQAITML
jgi:hypothetical protein